MRAMVLTKPGSIDSSPLAMSDVPVPEPTGDAIRVKVQACGICRTDLHVCEGELPPHRPQIIPGHQTVGTVDALGPEAGQVTRVSNPCEGPGGRAFKLGDRVGIAWLRSTCGVCKYCRAGNENLCPNALFSGYDEDGGFAEFALVREGFAYAIPPGIDSATATPLLCAGIIGYRALRRANIRPGCRLGLYGFGSSAHLAIQVARHLGCTVYAMTRDQRHQELARQLGAAWAGGAEDRPPELLDSAILFAPVGNLVPTALASLDQGGTLAVAGIYLTQIPPLDYERHLFHEKTLQSVTANTRTDGEELLKLAAEIPLRPHVTKFPLADANRALQQLKHDGIQGSGVLIL